MLSSMEDFEALESCSLTSADSKEDICVLKDTNKTRAQEQWEKIRNSVPLLLKLNSEMVRQEIDRHYTMFDLLYRQRKWMHQ